MKSRIKRIVTFVFSAVLCLSLFAIPAFAADVDDYVPVNVGEWTLHRFVDATGVEYNNIYYAITSNFIVAVYSDYKYTGATVDNDGNKLTARLVEYDSNREFIRRVDFSSGSDYLIHVESDCVYIRFELCRSTSAGIYLTLSDLDYFAVCGSGKGTINNPYLLYYVGEVFANALKWVVVTISTITANNILMLFCVALPLCSLGVGMFSRLLRARG